MQFSRKHSRFFLTFLSIFLLAAYGCSGLKSENQKLKEKITDINAENERLKKDLNALKAENSDVHARLTQLTQQISALQLEIQTLQKDLISIKSQAGGAGKKGKRT